MTPQQEALLRRLAINDQTTAIGALSGTSGQVGLDDRTYALARVAALIATESPLATYQWAIDLAIAAGATEGDVVDVLIAVAPIVGLARVTRAAPEVALALGYDVAQPDPP
jgi:alkylhydroperoxidase/carboxymuconolactone decarboxylase family protein YurZ